MIAWIALGVAVVGFAIVAREIVRLRWRESGTFETLVTEMRANTEHLIATKHLAAQVKELRAVVGALTEESNQVDADIRTLAAKSIGTSALRPRKKMSELISAGDEEGLAAWLLDFSATALN